MRRFRTLSGRGVLPPSAIPVFPVLLVAVLASPTASLGEEVTVQNDSLAAGTPAAVCPCFAAGESAASWLTSPCGGDLVAVQIYWRSLLGAPDTPQDAIRIFAAGTFPAPGAQLAILPGPLLRDGFFNEFRYLDENQTIPLSIAVAQEETFVVALRFAEDQALTDPSVVVDHDGCRANRNAIDVVSQGWVDACQFAGGLSGDWVIRAVIDCPAGSPLIFADGFESGDTSAWSDTVPSPGR